MTKEILNEKLPENSVSFRTTDFEKAYGEVSSPEERDEFINQFISQFLESHGITNVRLGFEDALKNLLLNTGAKAFKDNNPFLQWIVSYSDANGKDTLTSISNDDYNNLINLFSQNVIVGKDLSGKSGRKTETPLFTQDFFEKPFNEMKYIAQLFYWYQANYNRLYKSFEKMVNSANERSAKAVTEFGQLLLDRTIQTATLKKLTKEDLIDFILFEEGKFNNTGRFRDVRRISAAIDYLDDYDDSKTISDNDYANRNVDENNFKGKTIDIDKLSNSQAKDLIAYLFKIHPELKP